MPFVVYLAVNIMLTGSNKKKKRKKKKKKKKEKKVKGRTYAKRGWNPVQAPCQISDKSPHLQNPHFSMHALILGGCYMRIRNRKIKRIKFHTV
jgi:hypothetical protein